MTLEEHAAAGRPAELVTERGVAEEHVERAKASRAELFGERLDTDADDCEDRPHRKADRECDGRHPQRAALTDRIFPWPSVMAMGSAPTAVRLRQHSATACLPPSNGSASQ